MTLKNPSKEVWDRYWLGVYNQIERGLAWIVISIGAIIVLGFSAVKAAESFFENTTMPGVLKIGIMILTIGFVILIISLLREKLFLFQNDKYKEIQR